MAAIWKLPVVFVCENNQFAMSARPADVTSVVNLARRADALGIPGAIVDGMDVLAVFDAVVVRGRARPRWRRPEPDRRPTLPLRGPPRRRPAALPGAGRGASAGRERDPIQRWRERLIDGGLISDADATELAQRVDQEVQEAEEFAKAERRCRMPAAAWDDLYA